MVGEIRDSETANLAVQAALTGHLVLSTIHTNNSIGIVPRLLDMGVEPYLIPPVLILGMAQRLVKTLAPGGGKKVPVDNSTKAMFEQEFKDLPSEFRKDLPSLAEVHMPLPTPEYPTGLQGRIAVTEMFAMNQELERAILDRKTEEEMFATVRKQGMLTMKEDAIIKATQGVVPFTEVNSLGGTYDLADEETTQEQPAAQSANPASAPAAAPVVDTSKEIEI
jgi:type IV pilus assembly protein PilB